jgi:glycine/sarcosine/betaine reductase complex component A
VVLLGTPTAESSRLYALTVTEGDPAWAGALAGIPLALPVYHVTEDDIKAQVSPDVYEKHVALMEFAQEVDEIRRTVRDVREKCAGAAPGDS